MTLRAQIIIKPAVREYLSGAPDRRPQGLMLMGFLNQKKHRPLFAGLHLSGPACLFGMFGLVLWLAACSQPAAQAGPPLPATPDGPVLRIGLLSPQAGELATFGRMLRNGSTMVFETTNQQGGLLNHHLEWSVYESGCDFVQAQQAVQQAAADGIKFLIGPLCSEAAIGAAVAAEAEQVLLIAPTATHPLVTVDGQGRTRPTVFRASYVSFWQGQAAASFARAALQADRAALVFNPQDDYSVRLADAFARQFSGEGGQIIYRVPYTPGQGNLSQAVAILSRSEIQVVYLPVAPAVVNQTAGRLNEIYAAAAAAGAITLLGSDSWHNDELDLPAVAGSYFTTHFAAEDPRPESQAWQEMYKAIYAVEPTTLAALGYDAALVLITAIEQAGVPEVDQAAAALERATINGVTGKFQFDRQHNPLKPVPVKRVNPDRTVFYTATMPAE